MLVSCAFPYSRLSGYEGGKDRKRHAEVETGFGCGISGVHELGRGVAPMISVTRGMWGKSRPSKVAFSSILHPATTIERLKGKKRVRVVESVIANDV